MTLTEAREKAGPKGRIQCHAGSGGMHVINFATVKTISAPLALRNDWEVVPLKPAIHVFNNVTVEYNERKTGVFVEGLPTDFGLDFGKKYKMTLEEVSGGNEA